MTDRNIFINEDTSKPENRTNLSLFALLSLSEIHSFICTKLNIPQTSVIMPAPNLQTEEFGTGMRPDFKILNNGDLIGYIEVELGNEDKTQLANYRKNSRVPVYSVIGKEFYKINGGDLSLEEIYRETKKIERKYSGTQKGALLLHFQKLIKYYIVEGRFSASNKRAPISEKMKKTAIIQGIKEYFNEENINFGGNIEYGKLLINTVKENGFSVRVYCFESKNKSFSLMNRSAGRPQIEFPSKIKLLKYFPYDKEAVNNYVELIKNLGARNIEDLPERSRAKLPIGIVKNNIEKFCEAISMFV